MSEPGLALLEDLDEAEGVRIEQKIELFEIITGWETTNKYDILTLKGDHLYYGKEKSDCLSRCFCGSRRPFDMDLIDGDEAQVLHLFRPKRCDEGCCFLQILEVSDGGGTLLGSVRQKFSWCLPKFVVLDAGGSVVFRIKGPFCTNRCCRDVTFQILDAGGDAELGTIVKEFAGLGQEFVTDADNFNLRFPENTSTELKATLIGAVILLDFMYYEEGNGFDAD